MKKTKFLSGFTLRMCSTLDFEKALKNAYEYLNEFMAVDDIYLDTFSDDFRQVNRVCVVCKSGFNCRSETINVPADMAAAVRENGADITLTSTVLSKINDKEFKMHTGAEGNSGIAVKLKRDSKVVAYVILRAKGEDVYSNTDLEFLDGIEVPLSLAMGNFFQYNELVMEKNELEEEFNKLQKELKISTPNGIIGSEDGIFKVLRSIDDVVNLNSTILITGDTGVGKEVVAKYIHENSGYSKGGFVKIDCGAIPDALIESELFGYEKGAFTGASTAKKGKIERADGGTLFLDEIGELPVNAQTRLLRAIQHKEVVHLGSSTPRKIDCRIIAATNRDLEQMVQKGEFREDLWYRLNVFPIRIPPLRERRSDIPVLIRYMIKKKCGILGIKSVPDVSPGLMHMLESYDWPGNVREMENVVERELILNHKNGLVFSCILGNPQSLREEVLSSQPVEITDLDSVIREHISRVVGMVNGKISGKGGAAELLGLHPNTLRNKMIKLGMI